MDRRDLFRSGGLLALSIATRATSGEPFESEGPVTTQDLQQAYAESWDMVETGNAGPAMDKIVKVINGS